MSSSTQSEVSSVAAVLLAAGGSRRLGRPKQLLRFDDTPLVRKIAIAAVHSVCDPVVVVLGSEVERIAPVLEDLPVQLVVNEAWEEGLSSSLRIGLRAVIGRSSESTGALFMNCDQPAVDLLLLDHLVSSHESRTGAIIACRYSGILGTPALFPRETFSRLQKLEGDRGAGVLIRQAAAPVFPIDFPEGAFDLDTAQDYELWQERKGR